MLTHRYKTGTRLAGQKVLFRTNIWGKDYFWMEDGDGTIYLTPEDENGQPSFL